MLLNRNYKLIIVLFVITSSLMFSQKKEAFRHSGQFYIEDSAYVFWTHYPNPFSPPTVIEPIDYDTVITSNCHSFTSFYCELSDTVSVVIENESHSIYFNTTVTTKYHPYFSYCIWSAGIKVSKDRLPEKYFFCSSEDNLKIFLVVNDRKKCYRKFEGSGRYYWIKPYAY